MPRGLCDRELVDILENWESEYKDDDNNNNNNNNNNMNIKLIFLIDI